MKLPDFFQHAGLNDLRQQMKAPIRHYLYNDSDWYVEEYPEPHYEGWWTDEPSYLEFLKLEDSKSSE